MKKLEIEKGIVPRFVIGRRFAFRWCAKYMIVVFFFFPLNLTIIIYLAVQIVRTVWTERWMLKAGRPVISLSLYVEHLRFPYLEFV